MNEIELLFRLYEIYDKSVTRLARKLRSHTGSVRAWMDKSKELSSPTKDKIINLAAEKGLL